MCFELPNFVIQLSPAYFMLSPFICRRPLFCWCVFKFVPRCKLQINHYTISVRRSVGVQHLHWVLNVEDIYCDTGAHPAHYVMFGFALWFHSFPHATIKATRWCFLRAIFCDLHLDENTKRFGEKAAQKDRKIPKLESYSTDRAKNKSGKIRRNLWTTSVECYSSVTG